jgi:hypothetical protein
MRYFPFLNSSIVRLWTLPHKYTLPRSTRMVPERNDFRLLSW